MPTWIVDGSPELGVAAAKAGRIYLVALLGLRVAHRRTLAQWTAIDFAAAVAIGAIVGRTAIAGDQSFAVGAVALATILAAHWIAALGRYDYWFGKLVDHRVRVLVDHGRLRHGQLRLCGLIESELLARLRQQGVGRLSELRTCCTRRRGSSSSCASPARTKPTPSSSGSGCRRPPGSHRPVAPQDDSSRSTPGRAVHQMPNADVCGAASGAAFDRDSPWRRTGAGRR